jgi:hypothetical protein
MQRCANRATLPGERGPALPALPRRLPQRRRRVPGAVDDRGYAEILRQRIRTFEWICAQRSERERLGLHELSQGIAPARTRI